MRRTDRLFELIQILRDGRLHRAQKMADRLGVSLRTIYRDMETLMASGVPVQGERGIGYRVTAPVTLPPLNLTMTELEALHLGLAAVGAAADDELRDAAATLSAKIDAVLPEDRSAPAKGWGFAIYPFTDAANGFAYMPNLRAAIRARQKVGVDYTDADGTLTHRTLRPLELEYWGRFWTVTAWCEETGDFGVFRVDRITALRARPELFVEEQGKTLIDFRARRAGT
ncbi:helix-turn-helix transcriptional regulator [Oceaniglobus indicus]|uniref:helix-turn-helix transcriptional regulator n=1 Tax=Oceaniglobus indicus TaxID=2047749 RepID=UPI000C181B33|nr:YafY family protein [Oceaniglobus indicus]